MNISNSLMKLKNRIIFNKFSKFANPKKYEWHWDKKSFNRIALINYLISKTGGWESDYLEIGCNKNVLFNSIAVETKIGVDPLIGGTHRMTSDEFFKKYNHLKFNVIFVDGLHEYEQCQRDCLNSIKFLESGGIILFHDFLPRSPYEENVPRKQISWTGDVWKVAVELSNSVNVDFRIVNIDHGVGILKIKKDFKYNKMNNLKNENFDNFLEYKKKFPIITSEEGLEFIGQ